MAKYFGFPLVLWTSALFSSFASASALLDTEYSYKNFVVAIVNAAQEPIHADQVEKEMISFLKGKLWLDFSDRGYVSLKDSLNAINVPALVAASPEQLEFMRPQLRALYDQGVNAALIGEIRRRNGAYDLMLMLVTTARGEITSSTVESVEAPFSLAAFSRAAQSAAAKVLTAIPFNATVLRREGYLVVLDRGRSSFIQGTQIPAFSIELRDGNIFFEETGVISLERVEDNLAFGRVLVERRPREISAGNKIRLRDRMAETYSPELLGEPNEAERAVASYTSEFEVTKGSIGRLGVGLGAGWITYTNEKATGGKPDASNSIFPTTNIEGELWFTSRWFMSAGLGYATGKSPNDPRDSDIESGANISNFNMQFGYRVNLFSPDPGPVVSLKVGYGKRTYSFEREVEPLIYTNVAYGGIRLSGGLKVPVFEKSGIGVDVNTLVFASIAERPVTSGTKSKSIGCWDLALKGYTELSKDVDLEAAVVFSTASAEFEGVSTRTSGVDMKAVSQSSRSIIVGLGYYF